MEFTVSKAPATPQGTLQHICDAIRECQGIGIFDFDGVIADTEPLHARAYAMLLGEYGVHFDKAQFRKYIGRSEAEIYTLLEQTYAIRMDIQKDTTKRLEYFRRLVLEQDLPLSPLIQYVLDDASIPLHILSAQDPKLVSDLLAHWRVRDRFTIMQPSAAHPDKSALLAAIPTLMNVAPDRVFYFEDSTVFIEQGNQRGYRTVFIQHALNITRHVRSDWVITI